jgi:hypothetical protein
VASKENPKVKILKSETWGREQREPWSEIEIRRVLRDLLWHLRGVKEKKKNLTTDEHGFSWDERNEKSFAFLSRANPCSSVAS